MVQRTLAPAGEGGGDFPERKPIEVKSSFEAEIVSVEERDSRWDDEFNPGQKKKEYNFKFSIVDEGDFKDRWVWGSTSTWFADDPRCKLTNWIKAIYDEDFLPEGFVFDTEALSGLRCRIVVDVYDKRDGSIGNKVVEVKPSKGNFQMAPSSGPMTEEDPF